MSCFMLPFAIAAPESLLTEVAGNGDSFQVVRLDVLHDVSAQTLLSTDCANICLFKTIWAIWN